MSALIALLIILIALFFVWRVVTLMGRYAPEGEPGAPAGGDTGVLEPRPKRPPALAGAVALEEPDEE